MRKALLILASFLAFSSSFAPAWAEDSAALGKPLIQKPLRYRVDYAIDDKLLTFRIVAEPAIMGCGQVTDLPMKASFDGEAADITIGDYILLQPLGTGPKNCGTPYKASSTKISIDRDSMTQKNTRQVRLWYGHMLDTFTIQPTRSGGLEILPPLHPRMFFLGRNLSKSDPAPTTP